MARKVFLSVLGATPYSECVYGLSNDQGKSIFESEKTKFIQVATLDYINKKIQKWQKGDMVFILLTDKARKNNWEISENKRFNQRTETWITYSGLKSELESMEFLSKESIKEVDIKDGKNESEIWEIFENVYEIIDEKDELYIDITHAFRYIPMFLMVFCNYVKFMKKCKVRSITYGNFEASFESNGKIISPIIDITSFSDLQDWTAAANDFRSNGSVKKIETLYLPQSTHRLTLSIKEKGQIDENLSNYIEKKNSENAKHLKSFIDSVTQFEKQLITCQGKELIMARTVKSVKEKLKLVKDIKKPKPFDHIVDELEKSFTDFSEEENVKNGFVAAKWCCNNGLYQQAITLLEESLITYVCYQTNLNWKEKSYREIVSSALHIKKEDIKEALWNIPTSASQINNAKEIIRNILDTEIIKKIYKDFGDISDLRNEYNHASMLNKSKFPSDTLIKKIIEYVKKYCD